MKIRPSKQHDTLDVLYEKSDGSVSCTFGTVVYTPEACMVGLHPARIKLEVKTTVGTTTLWFMSRHSRKHRVFWMDENAKVADVWDCWLLDSARKAAVWITKFQLDPYLELGLTGLSRETQMTESPLTVALCIATMNRLWQLRRALPLNLLHCWPHRKWVRIHVVDFGSTDTTQEWLLRRCQAAIDCGLLVVYASDQLPFWHASVAKNTSHMVATEDILVNLDGDNLIGPGFPIDVVKHFFEYGHTGLQYHDMEGTCGRIACYRTHFHMLRGYDEDSLPMGAQDVDLVHRLKEFPFGNFRRLRTGRFSQAIPNTRDLKVCMCEPVFGRRWGRMDVLNRTMFKERRDAGMLVRNLHKTNIGVKAWRVQGVVPSANGATLD